MTRTLVHEGLESPMQQSNDALRSEIQTSVREAVRGATQAARDAAREAARAQAQAEAQGGGGLLTETPAPPVASKEVLEMLQAQITAEKANIDRLTTQLTPGISNAAERAIRYQLADSREHLKSLQGQLERAMGVPDRVERFTMQPGGFNNNDIPPQVIPIVSIVMSTLAAMVILGPLARAMARRMDRRNVAPAGGPDLSPRLERIEQGIEAIAIEVERVSEGQRFTTRLMSEMRALPAANPMNEFQGVQQRMGEGVERKAGG
jgi:hypothetical protein